MADNRLEEVDPNGGESQTEVKEPMEDDYEKENCPECEDVKKEMKALRENVQGFITRFEDLLSRQADGMGSFTALEVIKIKRAAEAEGYWQSLKWFHQSVGLIFPKDK